jgi:peptidoglycan hydrolase CwlO-like protein
MLKTGPVILLALLCAATVSLHLLDNTQAQIEALKNQQDNFEKAVNKLITNITQIEEKLNGTSNTDEKIIIL